MKLPVLAKLLKELFTSSSDMSSVIGSQTYKNYLEFGNKMRSIAQEHEVLLGQISDRKLHGLIVEAIKIQGEALVERSEVQESITKSKDFESLTNAFNKNNEILIGVQHKLMGINKRIEELLCGDEPE